MAACEKAGHNQVHKRIVDQIVAVDDFIAFKKSMIKRNSELNQQAMKVMEKKNKAAAKEETPTQSTEESEALKRKNTDKLLEE